MRWLPLESNPEVMNQWCSSLGLDTEKVNFTDIYGLDEDLLSMVPTPVYSVLMLFPISEQYEAYKNQEDLGIKKQSDEDDSKFLERLGSRVLFIKQTISNACGTIGLLHSLSNNSEIPIKEGPLKKFFESCKAVKDPLERAKLLESNDEIANVHSDLAQIGQSRVPDENEEVNLHFVCFIKTSSDNDDDELSNRLVELDGRKNFPIDHGKLLGNDLLHGVVPIVKKFMELSKDDLQFNLIALCPKVS